MKKLFMYLSLFVMPFALAGNKESVKEVKAEVEQMPQLQLEKILSLVLQQVIWIKLKMVQK